MQSLLMWTLSGSRHVKLLLAILWVSSGDIAFLHACQDYARPQALDNGFTCVTDYRLRISCVLNATAQPLNNASSHWLEFQHWSEEDFPTFECQLVNVGECFSCTSEMAEEDSFTSHDYFEITLHSKRSGHETCMSMNYTFKPADNVKPDAPSNLTVVRNSSGYLFTWVSNYESHWYPSFRNTLQYRLTYHRPGFPDEVVHSLGKTLYIDDIHLETDAQYTAAVSSHPGPSYKGQWSEWSPLVHWRTKAIPVRDLETFRFLWNIALPICIVAGIFLCFFFSPTVRLKIKVWSFIPTPGPYFQPLFKSYKGDFRSWLVSQGAIGEPLKMEEAVKIHTLTEAQQLKEEEEEEEEACPPSPKSQPMPCTTPYVTAGNEGWCTGNPAHSPNQGYCSDAPTSLSLIKSSLVEIFGSQSLGLVLASEGDWGSEKSTSGLDWENKNPTSGLDWERDNPTPSLDWENKNPTPSLDTQSLDWERGNPPLCLDWESKNPIPSLDCCWPQDALMTSIKGLCGRQDYCTLWGPHNELIPGAMLRPANTDKDSHSGCSHNALSPQADVKDVEA